MSEATSRLPHWLRYLPACLRARLEHRPHLVKVILNTGWLLSDKVLRMGVGVFVGAWVARYLGPADFGLFSFATAFVALFGAIAALGLNGIVVRDLVKQPEISNEILGTAFLLQVIAGFVAFGLAVLVIGFVRPGDELAKLMVAVLGFVLVLKSTSVVKYWFESQVQSKYSVWVENGAFLFVAAVKVVLILIDAPLHAFAWAAFGEASLVAAGLIGVYLLKGEGVKAWKSSYRRAVSLIHDSWPVLLSGSFVLVHMSIDRVMLGYLATEKEVGIYSASQALVGLWYFIPVAVGGSLAPRFTKLIEVELTRYEEYTTGAYRYFALGSLFVAAVVYVSSGDLISFLYGDAYAESGLVLSIGIWSVVFVSLVSLRGRLLLIEGRQAYSAWISFMAVALNIMLNLWLIPLYGATGAACSFSISWGLSAIVLPLLFRATRHHSLLALGLRARAKC